MLTTHTQAEAKQRKCHRMMVQDKCIGCQCMAWQWADRPRLTTCTGLLPEHQHLQFSGFGDEEETPHLEEAFFTKPDGAWRFNDVSPDEDGWMAHWERDSDPDREGYCATLNHPLLLQGQLEDAVQALYGIRHEISGG